MIWLLAAFVIGFGFYEVYVSKGQTGTIASYASNAGFSGVDLAIAIAIAYAESSGNPDAVGDNGDSIGLWQINLPNHPEYEGSDLTDPQTNASAAYAIYQAAGDSFTPWTTFKTGAYSQYLGSDGASDGQ